MSKASGNLIFTENRDLNVARKQFSAILAGHRPFFESSGCLNKRKRRQNLRLGCEHGEPVLVSDDQRHHHSVCGVHCI